MTSSAIIRKSKRPIRAAIVHCTATPQGRNVTMKDLHKWHVIDNGWNAPGYHFLIQLSGLIEKGRNVDFNGAHAKHGGWNKNTIGIAMAGGLGLSNRPEPIYTPEQWQSLDWLLAQLRAQYKNIDIFGHRDTGADKACPSFDVRHYVKTGKVRL